MLGLGFKDWGVGVGVWIQDLALGFEFRQCVQVPNSWVPGMLAMVMTLEVLATQRTIEYLNPIT